MDPKMESVRAFNSELFSLYEHKIPISKAKMILITRSAMKAIKFYKHVVQSVEKFIQKCKTEYKIPGLYVIDSIVRQSRHQFGCEKDVFAPRFARNMEQTFVHLYRCPAEEKSKIIRVLNLWQKNNVFAPEVIQPLFDLANPDHPLHQQYQNPTDTSISNGMNTSGIAQDSPIQNQAEEMNAEMLSQASINDLQQYRQLLLRQAQQAQSAEAGNSNKDSVKFNKKLLDFDYGSDEDDDKQNSPHLHNQLQLQQQNAGSDTTNVFENNNIKQILSNPNVIKQLQQLQKLKQQQENEDKKAKMRKQEEAFEMQLSSILTKLPFASECDLSRHPPGELASNSGQMFQASLTMANVNTLMAQQNALDQKEQEAAMMDRDERQRDGGALDIIDLDANSRSPSPNRYNKRMKSRSRSPRDRRDRDRDRRRRSRTKSRSRSRSPRSRRRNSSRDRMKEKEREKERENEKERRRRGLPEIKKDHLSVCSTTLWVGHLSKLVQQEDLSDTFGKFGDIVSIDMIHPRGCAFIVMNRRQDAYKAMQGLKNHKMHGRIITISWAAGKGVKSKEWKDYWDLELGVSYIPYNKLSESTDFVSLEEGGMFDDETMSDWMKEKLKQKPDDNTAGSAVTLNPDNPMLSMFGLRADMPDTSQPPPGSLIPGMTAVPQFSLTGMPRLMTPMGIPMGITSMTGLGVAPPMLSGMMVPGMPHMTAPPPLDKSIPPPNTLIPPPFGVPSSTMASGNSDDQMDIEMEDENQKEVTNIPSLLGPAFFAHPPPGMAGLLLPNIPPPSLPTGSNTNISQDTNKNSGNDNGEYKRSEDRSQSRERDRDYNRDRRGRDRDRSDRRDRDRDRSDRSGGGRGDYRDRNDRNEDRERRWGKDNDFNSRDRRGDRNDRRSGDRSDNKNLQDRLRDMAGEAFGNNAGGQDRFGRGGEFPIGDFPSGQTGNFGGGRNRHQIDDNIASLQNVPPLLGRNGPRNNDFNVGRQDRDEFDRIRGAGPGRFQRGGRMGMNGPPFNQRGGPGFNRGGGRGFHNNFNDRAGFFDREFDDGPRGGGRMRGGPIDRRGGGRSNWRGGQPGSNMENEDEHRGNRDFNRFDKNKRNASRWAGSNQSQDSEERIQDNNENWDQDNGDPDVDSNDMGNTAESNNKMDSIEDNGPPGFENETNQTEERNFEQNEPSFSNEPPAEVTESQPPASTSEPPPPNEPVPEDNDAGSQTPLCDEPENKE